ASGEPAAARPPSARDRRFRPRREASPSPELAFRAVYNGAVAPTAPLSDDSPRATSTMSHSTLLYRAGKRLLHMAPASLLRARPFNIYEIPLQRADDNSKTEQLPKRDSRGELPCDVRWVTDGAEAAALRPLATADNLAALDFSSRRAAAAWCDGQPVACAWIAAGHFEETELGLRFELRPAEAWLFAAVVAAAQRDRGVYRQVLRFLVDELQREGLQRILLGAPLGNEPSRSLGCTICRTSGHLQRASSGGFALRQPIRLIVGGAATA
ncbi:MAG TPA: hypothetical protein PJ982_08035, partial [Lacipirellulaceae bacterium]|nr:hypothetical protein [Lacipirellulaceae bacterium]